MFSSSQELHLRFSVDSIGVHAPPSWKVVQHQQKHLVEVASHGCWGVHSEQGESGIVVLVEAVGAIVQCVVLVMKQTPYHIS